MASVGAVILALLFNVLSAQNIVGPITAMISDLKKSRKQGCFPSSVAVFHRFAKSGELTSSFNRAAGAIREARAVLFKASCGAFRALWRVLSMRAISTPRDIAGESAKYPAIATAMGIAGDELNDIRIGALSHDIGKIGISDTVLQKPGKLTAQEFAIVKQHPVIGREFSRAQGFAVTSPRGGTPSTKTGMEQGYPRGESGETTPLAARIIYVSDTYDAMTTDRPYRRGLSHDQAIAIITEFAGRQFDPQIVDVFVGIASAFAPWRTKANQSVKQLEYARMPGKYEILHRPVLVDTGFAAVFRSIRAGSRSDSDLRATASGEAALFE